MYCVQEFPLTNHIFPVAGMQLQNALFTVCDPEKWVQVILKPSRGISCCNIWWDYIGQIVLRLTCLSPDGQILILLDIQHDLQSISHSALFAFPGCRLVAIKSVAFPISGVNLEENRFLSWTWQSPHTGCDKIILMVHCNEGRDMEEKNK